MLGWDRGPNPGILITAVTSLGDRENRPFILQRRHLQRMIQQLMSLPKLSCGPGTGRSLQCLTPWKYIILNNILWFTKHFLIIVLLGFTFYFCLEYCLSRFDDSSTNHLPQFLPCEPIPTCVHLDILSCPHVLLQPGPTQAAELLGSLPEILHLEGWLSPLVVIFPVA